MIRRVVSVISQIVLLTSLLLPQATVLATTVEPEEPGCEYVEWLPVPDCFADPTGEPGIGTDYSDLVGTQDYPAAFYCFDENAGGYAHFRERIVADPTTSFGFKNAAWVVVLDFDSSEGYEYLISLSGKQDEWVTLFSNRVGERQIPFLFSPTNVDSAEDMLGTRYPAIAPYAEDGHDDSGSYWFATWALPIQMLVNNMPEVDDAADFNELIDSGHLKLYFGTSEDDNNYNKDVLDCCTPAMLTVCKVVVNDDGGTATAHDWDFVIFDADGNAVATQRPVSDEENCVTFSLSGGTYTIVEVGPDGYVASYSGDSSDGTITRATEEEASVTITNDDAPATVTLHKTVTNDGDGTLTADDFQAYLDGNPVAWETAIEVLPGSHTVSEDSEPGYSASSWSGDCNASGDLTVELGGSYDCYITNDDDDNKATLTVCKIVVSDDGGEAAVSDFTFVISDAGGEVDRATPVSEVENCVAFTLDAGTYTISELGPEGYAPTFSGDSTDGTITLAPGDDKTVTVTNNDFDPTITVCKVLINDDGGQAVISDFEFVLTNSQGVEVGRQSPASEQEPCVSFVVDEGTYTITEEGPSGYVATFSGDCTTDGTVYLSLGDSKTVTVTNDDDEPGSGYAISGHKYCCGDGECSDTGIEGWEITLIGPLEDEPVQQHTTLTDENGYYEFAGLTPGTYIVSETPVENWESCTPEDATIVVGPGSGAVYSTPGGTEYQEGSSWLPAAASWEPNSGTDPSYWDTSLTGHSFSSDADWVWESYRVVHPISGDVVNFRQQFTVPGTPGEGDLWITVDNGYEVYLNGTFVGTAQVHNVNGTDWQDSLRYEAWVNGHGWESVEHFDVSALLVSGVNTLIIETANEYMGQADNQITGTVSANPAGLIFELTYTTEPTEAYVVDFCNSPVAEASSNSPVCEGSDIELSGGPAGMDSYAWTGPNGFSSDDRNPTVDDATLADAGQYTLTITSRGCSASASTTVAVSDAPDASASAQATSVCVGSDIELLGGPTGTGFAYAWSGPADFTSSQQNPVIPNATKAMEGIYTLTVENASGCTGEDTVTITVGETPTADFKADDTSVCVGYDVTFSDLSSGSPTSWSWDFGDDST
ncbi:MAG: hypothetical protein M0R22_03100, partial [Dehalococcoidia bacterium]|nr:hypothetical protein [Dehalococcoidia bacterium]